MAWLLPNPVVDSRTAWINCYAHNISQKENRSLFISRAAILDFKDIEVKKVIEPFLIIFVKSIRPISFKLRIQLPCGRRQSLTGIFVGGGSILDFQDHWSQKDHGSFPDMDLSDIFCRTFKSINSKCVYSYQVSDTCVMIFVAVLDFKVTEVKKVIRCFCVFLLKLFKSNLAVTWSNWLKLFICFS